MLGTQLQVQLLIGPVVPRPAPAELMEVLRSIEVQRAEQSPSGFQLSFTAECASTCVEFALLASGLLERFSRVIVLVAWNGPPRVLIDGFITYQELIPGGGLGDSILAVTGEDVSVKMNMVELSTEYPEMSDAQIVERILERYGELIQLTSVSPPLLDLAPVSYVPQQNCTDRILLQKLARRHGFYFCVRPAAAPGSNIAYWGPPEADLVPQTTLTVSHGGEGNLSDVSFGYDALAPSVTYGSIAETTSIPPLPAPIARGASTRLQGFAAIPGLEAGEALAAEPFTFVEQLPVLRLRGSLFKHEGMTVGQAEAYAQALTDYSTDPIVTADGELDTLSYGDLLVAPGVVELRGAGLSYDGKYFVSEVTHRIDFLEDSLSYRQRFRLRREGTGTTIDRVMP